MTIQEVAQIWIKDQGVFFRRRSWTGWSGLVVNALSLSSWKPDKYDLAANDWEEVLNSAEATSKATRSTSESPGLQAEEPEEA